MWEAIESNRRRTRLLVIGMGMLLASLVAGLGAYAAGRDGALPGVALALALWAILWGVAVAGGDRIMLGVAGARKIGKHDAPQLFNVVEEMTIASGLGRMPDVYLIPDETPNAFAAGRKPETRVVAVTSGLLRILNRDELQGVVAHEMGHHKNGDTKLMILMGVMLGAIILIADVFLRMRFIGGGRRSKGGGHPLLIILAIVMTLLAPILARLLYFACSRRREFLADASAARFTRYPEGLASALEKISAHFRVKRETNRVLAPMYIVNPMQALAAVGLFSTHPPTSDRVRILRSMGGGAGYTEYDRAYRAVQRATAGVIGKRTMAADAPVGVRAPSVEAGAAHEEDLLRSREVHDLLARLDDLTILTCACGVGIKVPAGLRRSSIPCPRCGRENPVPHAEVAPAPESDAPPLRYRRQGRGWESFQCACGKGIQLSPAFEASATRCRACGRTILVES